MHRRLINYCPKCGCTELDVVPEPAQFSLSCRRCNFYCEIIVFDEGDFDGLFEGGSP
ncbi:MAG: hypothetical protein K6T29_03350 [Peptococcaceae bacterium]|nr:hypothetical protein [Peptococcaceae bacterium]